MHHSITPPQLIPLIDLTRLTENDREEAIHELCELAQTPYGNVAAVCIYANFIGLAKKWLVNTPIKIATVANFPDGNKTLEACTKDINISIENGADEIDIVFPYHHFLAGKIDDVDVREFLQVCKNTCGKNIILKVILETGALLRPEVIAHATDIAILAGADFIKTSTGKISVGATLQ